jgi:transposase-like protein
MPARPKPQSRPASHYAVRCPSCAHGQLREAYNCGLEGAFAWRCLHCNVRFVVTNPSYLIIK